MTRKTTPDPKQEALESSTQKWMLWGLILMGLFVLAFPLFRFYEPARRADARTSQEAYLATLGGQIYADNCASCHGTDGTGAIAPAIGAMEFLASVEDIQIEQLIALGVPGTEMVAYSLDFGGPFTSEDIDAVTVYLRSLEEREFSLANWRAPLENEDLSGGQLYTLACSRCHGVDLAGDPEQEIPALGPTSAALESSDVFLFGRISEGYQQMPRFGNTLSDAQIESIIAYLRFGNEPPPTTTTTTTAPTGTTVPGTETTTTTVAEPPNPDNDEQLALGKLVWEVTAGGIGCQDCHGPQARGTSNGPDIQGAGRTKIATALAGGVVDMNFDTPLTSAEIDAVAAYLTYLTAQANAGG